MDPATPPDQLPLFPLTGVLLLPGLLLPFQIFEPRYRNLVADALEGPRYLGMIQPLVPSEDNRPVRNAPPENPELYPVGCACRIEQSEKTPDGRYLVHLRGVIRFRILEELPLVKGYRVVRADYGPFATDRAENPPLEVGPLIEQVVLWGQHNGHEMERERLKELAPDQLINGIATSLPFAPAEKQALLEAKGPAQRLELLISLLGMGVDDGPESPKAPPNLN